MIPETRLVPYCFKLQIIVKGQFRQLGIVLRADLLRDKLGVSQEQIRSRLS